jgi:hypothetical protein
MKSGSAQFALLALDGTNLLGAKVKGFSWKPELLQEDTTGLGDAWREFTPTGIRRAVVTQEGAYFDTAAAGMHAALAAMPLGPRTLTWSPDGVLVCQARGTLVTTYDVVASLGALTKANVTYTISGSLDVGGAIVQAPEDHPVSWTGPVLDQGAATAAGGTASQQVTRLDVGVTGFAGVLNHSPDGTAWTALVTFVSVTAAPNGQSVTVAGLVQRYLQFVGTITGTGTVRVAAGFFRS